MTKKKPEAKQQARRDADLEPNTNRARANSNRQRMIQAFRTTPTTSHGTFIDLNAQPPQLPIADPGAEAQAEVAPADADPEDVPGLDAVPEHVDIGEIGQDTQAQPDGPLTFMNFTMPRQSFNRSRRNARINRAHYEATRRQAQAQPQPTVTTLPNMIEVEDIRRPTRSTRSLTGNSQPTIQLKSMSFNNPHHCYYSKKGLGNCRIEQGICKRHAALCPLHHTFKRGTFEGGCKACIEQMIRDSKELAEKTLRKYDTDDKEEGSGGKNRKNGPDEKGGGPGSSKNQSRTFDRNDKGEGSSTGKSRKS